MGKHLRKLAGLCLFALLLGACVAGSPNPGGAGDDPSVVDPPVVDPEPTYTITWKNYDDSVLEIDREVSYGATPKYDGKTPVRPDDDTYSYTFSGWDPGLKRVTADATYKAIYIGDKIKHFYTIDFDLDGGTSASYSGPKTVEEFSKDLLFFDCVKEGWSFRGWSYQGTKVFDEKGNQLATFSMAKEMTFVATYTQTAKLTITTNMEGAGSISGEGEYPYNTYVDVSVVPNQGYDFVGWYYDNTILSSTPDYKYMMWSEDVTLEARFKLASFTLTIYSNNEDLGLVLLKSGTNSKYLPAYEAKTAYTERVTVAAYSKTDIRFLGWYDEDNDLVETNAVYSFVMPNHDYSLEAKWDHFTINYVLNGGTNNPSNPTEYNTESGSITLEEPSRPDYEFVGWTLDNELVSAIDPSWVRDVTLVANWRGALYALSVTSNDESKGTASLLSGSGYAGEIITVGATPAEECALKGWYVGGTKVSGEATFTFTMPASDYGLVAHFWTKTEEKEEEETWNAAHGITPTLSNDGKSMTYGLYPQTRVNDSALLSSLGALGDSAKGANGWYLYDGEYYAKVSAKPYLSSFKFDDGTAIVDGATYWFLCEAIKWDVLSETDGEYYVLSDVLLDAHCYYNSTSTRKIGGKTVYANNYEHSDIRAWLNGDFYDSAFALGNSAIQTAEVDNSATTTNNDSNQYACANTADKVFLPSCQDYLRSDYGFSASRDSTSTRYCKTTDWTRARGAYYYASSSYLYSGRYWTRSPGSEDSYCAWYVSYDGNFHHYENVNAFFSVRPGLSVRIA